MSKQDKYITLCVFQNIHQAYIMRDLLILNGIKASVMGEETVMNNLFYSDNLGGAKLRVIESQLEHARALYDKMETVKNN